MAKHHHKVSDANGVGPKTLVSHDSLTLGSQDASLLLQGNDIDVTGTSGNVTISGPSSSNDVIKLGNGADIVSLGGKNDQVTLGGGSDVVAFGSASTNDTVTINGNNLGVASITLNGTSNAVFLNGGGFETINDTAGSSDSLGLHIGAAGGQITLNNFSAGNGVVELASGLGFTSSSQVVADLQQGPNGATFLNLNGHGELQFTGIAPSQLSNANFQIG